MAKIKTMELQHKRLDNAIASRLKSYSDDFCHYNFI